MHNVHIFTLLVCRCCRESVAGKRIPSKVDIEIKIETKKNTAKKPSTAGESFLTWPALSRSHAHPL